MQYYVIQEFQSNEISKTSILKYKWKEPFDQVSLATLEYNLKHIMLCKTCTKRTPKRRNK